MDIPLGKKLRKRIHADIGTLQDQVVEIIYNIKNDAVFHGGTAIWRCYNGNRFSEDLDFYIKNTDGFAKEFEKKVNSAGLIMNKMKKTDNLIFSKISDGNVEIRAEFNFSAYKNGTIKRYERIDGTFTNVFTLTAEELIVEKIAAYSNRRFIRDIYDIFHLMGFVTDQTKVKKDIAHFLPRIPKPIDEENLKTIVYSGAIPSFKQMTEAIKRWGV